MAVGKSASWTTGRKSTLGLSASWASISFGRRALRDLPSKANNPVNFVSWLVAIRFVKWLHNCRPTGPQGPGTTESGAYAIDGDTAVRSANALYFLPTDAEWARAAYHDPAGDWLYPTRSNTAPTPATVGSSGDVSNDSPNVANYRNGARWNQQNGNVTTTGSCGPRSTSFYGTYDQGGNIREWTETVSGDSRTVRGGGWHDNEEELRSSTSRTASPTTERNDIGFRIGRSVNGDGDGPDCGSSLRQTHRSTRRH